ncbi:MAG: response regulator [Desulfobulbaceae bacterium]|nr:response regulator [Desulfobulbaceae bacterium]
MTEKILFVDDEPNVLQSIQRQLHKRFPLQIAEGGEDALRILREEGPFAVIVSDMRMPRMTGVELLAQTKDLYPDMVRLMLTGNADQETAMEAVNTGQIFRFLTKPCPPAVFITSLALAVRQHRLITAEKELLQKTLRGSINVLSELLAVANPLAFSSGLRIRDYVVKLASIMELPNLWQYEIAAVMSQIGCITLPGDVLNKIYAGQELNQDETHMYESHPMVGKSLLEKIPRLENITKMIELQQKRFDAYTKELAGSEFEEILTGAQILKVAIDFDRQLFQGKGSSEIQEWMRKQHNCYNPQVLDALEIIKVNEREQLLHLNVEKIGVGMVAADDILAKNGVLVIPKGQVITWPLLQGLKNFSMQVGIVEPIRVQVGQSSEGS